MANYLYNGVELPPLPEWDKETYPYAVIMSSGDWHYVYAMTVIPHVATSGKLAFTQKGKVYSFYKRPAESSFSEFTLNSYDAGEEFSSASNVLWSDFDLLDEDGTVYLAASEPVPVGGEETAPTFTLDLNAWLTGFALGLCGKPLPFAKKTPIAYSYNGTVLPALPEWDRESYPYAVIEYAEVDSLVSGGRMARLIISSESIVYTQSGLLNGYNLSGDVVCYGWANDEFVWKWSLNMDAPTQPYNEWVQMSEEHFDETTFKAEQALAANPTWANHDLIWTLTGNVIVAASEPVPVYE